ncbi:RNA polymerase sigma-70 factor [Algoriphagus sp.]|uniref:RNA polymerase sigma-70 factor n=1 Tax=Algoriphagus sp. TaxID=1872435 RepID=UPI00260A5DA3|nr:RNA polymerase sigma-70 factor [Algoriphagus sp.]
MLETDRQVFLAIQSGQNSAFEMLFKTYYQPLCRYANSYLKDPDGAEEIVQAVFIGFWEKRKSISIDTSLKSYLYRAIRNSCLNELKHEKVKQKYFANELLKGEEQIQPADHLAIHVELEDKIRAAIQTLPEQCRLIFTMSRFEELKYQQIADQLNLSVKTVENQMGKALKIMRVQLKEYLPLVAILMNKLLES